MILEIHKKIGKVGTKVLALILVGCVVSGCTIPNPRQKTELDYRKAGIAYMEKGAYQNAVSAFQKALDNSNGRISEVELDICFYKACALMMLEDYEGARSVYDAILSYDKDSVQGYFQRGHLEAKLGEVAKAVEDYNKAISMDQKNFSMYLSAYENLYGLDNGKESALSYLKQATSIAPETGKDHCVLGQIYMMLEDYEMAKHEFSEAENKGNNEARLYMGKVLEVTGENEAAFAIYKSYAKEHENDGEALSNLITVLMADEKYETALEYMDLAVKNVPEERKHEILGYQIIIYEKMQQYEKAKDLLTEYVELYPQDEKAVKELAFLKTRIKEVEDN